MVDIRIVCKKCKEELVVEDTFATAIVGEIGIKVTPCDCTSKPDDCSECEDLKYLKNKLAASEVKLQNIQMFLDGGPEFEQTDKPAQPDKFDSHKPTEEEKQCTCHYVHREGVHLSGCPLHPATKVRTHATMPNEEEPGVNTLQPTEDVVSTGGAKIPGIKKGSAEGTKADYSKGLPG